MEQSIFHSWQDVYELNNGGNNVNGAGSTSKVGTKTGQAQSDGNDYPIDAEY
jgi:hypothetical protein